MWEEQVIHIFKYTLEKKTEKTTTKKKTLTPEYNESFDIQGTCIVKPTEPLWLEVEVYDWNRIISNKPMGYGRFDVRKLKRGVATNVWIPLMIKPGSRSGSVKGSVHLQITPKDFGIDPNTPFVPTDFKPVLDFLEITPVNAVTDITNIMAKFNLLWDNMEFNLANLKMTVKPAGMYIEKCLRKLAQLSFADSPAGVDKEGLKAALVDIAKFFSMAAMGAPLLGEDYFNTFWENFEKKDDLIPNLYDEFCDAQKHRIIDKMNFTPEQVTQMKEKFPEWQKTYVPKRNSLITISNLFEVANSDSIFEDLIALRQRFQDKEVIKKIMLKALFESYFVGGKTTVNETEFTEFMQTAISVFHLTSFKNDTLSIKKLFEDVDKDKSGSIDQYEFLYWFDLKTSMETVQNPASMFLNSNALQNMSALKIAKMVL